MALIDILSKDSTKKTKSAIHSPPAKSTSSSLGTHIIQEQIEDEIVDYEPWMDNYGRNPQGIEFDERDEICKKHPELWLSPHQYSKLLETHNGGTSRHTTVSTSATGSAGSLTSIDAASSKIKSTKSPYHSSHLQSSSNPLHTMDKTVAGELKKPKKKKKKDEGGAIEATSGSSETPNGSQDIDRFMQMGILQMNDDEINLLDFDDLGLGDLSADAVFTS
jgi:hypothetical protein